MSSSAGERISTGTYVPSRALITSADIRDGSVDFEADSVMGVDVKNGSLTSNDLSAAAQADLTGTAGACGAGQEFHWLSVGLLADGSEVDRSVPDRTVRNS